MAVTFGSSSVAAEATTVNTTYTAPSGIVDGDLLLIIHFEFGTTPVTSTPATAPAGFVSIPGTWPKNIGGDVKLGLWFWYKIASGESGNYVVTHLSCINRGMMARVTGNDTSNPFSPTPTFNNGTGATTTFTGLTTTVDGCLIMAFGVDDNDNAANLTAPTGTTPTFTERIDDNHGNYLATGNLSPAGATGNKTMTNNSGATFFWVANLLSIQPAAAAVPPPNTVMAPMTH